jgi:hypothetical protein
MSELNAVSLHSLLDMHFVKLLYLGLGVLTLVIAGGTHLWQNRHNWGKSQSSASLLDALNPERKKLWYRFRAWVLAPVLVVLAMVLLWPVAWWMKFADLLGNWRAARIREDAVFKVKRPDLLERLPVEEIESREIMRDPLHAVPDLPFGHLNSVWTRLKAMTQTQDEFWSFDVTWLGDFGRYERRKGYVLWRRNKPVDFILTMRRELREAQPKI